MSSIKVEKNSKLQVLKKEIEALKSVFWMFFLLILCVKGAECLIRWNSPFEMLLSVSVAATTMVALLACRYGNNQKECARH